ncbi:MAG: MFS transporter [Pseudomonadota bacterium]|nr:MFS transporter [Pseudomonadota bacterium]
MNSRAGLLFLATLAWNIALGVSHIVVPLYAYELGFSAATIGILFSVPVIGQLLLGLVGGATSDRWGGRSTLLVACGSFVVAPAIFLFTQGFWLFFAGQLLLILGRAVFWPASQSLASELPGERSVQMGRLNALVSVGQIIGTAGTGLLLALAGFQSVFAALGIFGLAGTLATLGLPRPPDRRHAAPGALFGHFGPLLRGRPIYFALVCAFLCAQPVSLGQSVFPLLLQSLGHTPEAIGPILALRPAGATIAILLLARWIGSARGLWYATGAAVLGTSTLIVAPLCTHPVAAGLVVGLMGVGAGLVLLFYQLIVSAFSEPHTRGSALAIAGSGWSMSHIVAPFVVGFVAETTDLTTAFQLWGVGVTLVALSLPWLHRWSHPSPG